MRATLHLLPADELPLHMAAVLIRGRVAGTWDLTKEVVKITEFRTFSARERRGLAREVERLGHYLGASVTLG
jgi:hypothetical protein